MHASESLHCRNLRMAHYIRRNLPQKFAVSAYWIPWRNAKLIHEQKGYPPMNSVRFAKHCCEVSSE